MANRRGKVWSNFNRAVKKWECPNCGFVVRGAPRHVASVMKGHFCPEEQLQWFSQNPSASTSATTVGPVSR